MVVEAVFVIIGGGIAGVSCAETLAFLEPEQRIILISESSLIKTVTNLHAITRTLTDFDIQEQSTDYLSSKYDNITVLHDSLTEINSVECYILTSNYKVVYKYICLCMGAVPKLIPQADQYPDLIIGIRDTDSVDDFIEKLKKAKRVVVVGNGGIASELVFKMKNIEIYWVIKDKHITATFIDPGAAEFFQDALKENIKSEEHVSKRMRYSDIDEFRKSGAALGPDWYRNLTIEGSASCYNHRNINITYNSEVVAVDYINNSLKVKLNNGDIIDHCDLLISATGVKPRDNFKMATHSLARGEDGGILVNEFMQTSIENIYAAGDICNANWDLAKHWFQMKLWTQARQMGAYAAKSMSGHFKKETVLPDFCFELFAHSTKLFGFKVILLGLYNGQKLGTDYEILVRVTKGKEYVKFVLQDNKLQGAILIGETDLEETVENLILNQLDLTPFGDDILNPDIDIEDYFD